MTRPPMPPLVRVTLLAALVFLLAAAAIALTVRDPGLTWDEAIYYGFAINYAQWFADLGPGSFAPRVIAGVWWAGQDHPPLGSVGIALSIVTFLPQGLDLIAAARMGAAILFGLTAAVIFLWVAGRRNERTGLLAAGIFILLPRVFAHAHFANLEMLMVLLWVLTVAAFERGIRSRGWSVLCGVFFGLALLTKINAVFLPVLLVPWGLIFHGRKALRNVAAMAVLGPLIFMAGWPVMWLEPAGALKAYLHDKFQRRMIIPVWYMGQAWKDRFAPWHYPFVILLVTTPLPVLAAAAAGAWRAVKNVRVGVWECGSVGDGGNGRNRAISSSHTATLPHSQTPTPTHSHTDVLLLWAAALPVLLLAMPNVPKYDGMRLMLPAFPFIAALAADGALAAWDWLGRCGAAAPGCESPAGEGACPTHGLRKRCRIPLACLAALWLLAPVVMFHPWQLGYYNELVAGPWGAKKLGFETTYWDDTFNRHALKYLNDHVPPGGKVAFVAMGEFVWQYYVAVGEAREDIGIAEFQSADWDYLVVIPRQGWWTDEERRFVETHSPAWSAPLGPLAPVPVCMIYLSGDEETGRLGD